MYGINLQLFNSQLKISMFDNLPKKLHFAQIAQKKLRKTKILFHAQFSQKIFPVLRKLRKKKNSAKLIAFHAKIAQKFAKKKIARK